MVQSTSGTTADSNPTASQTTTPASNEDAEKKPLLSLAAILRLLAELSKSYAAVARIIVDYSFEGAGLAVYSQKYVNVSFFAVYFFCKFRGLGLPRRKVNEIYVCLQNVTKVKQGQIFDVKHCTDHKLRF